MSKKLLVSILALSGTLVGCAGPTVKQTPIPPCNQAAGGSCFTEYRGDMAAQGGGIVVMGAVTTVNPDNTQTLQTVVGGIMPDRVDTILPTAIAAGGQVWAADKLATGTVKAAKATAAATKYAAKHSGPATVVNVSAEAEGGSASAGAAAMQSTGVEVNVVDIKGGHGKY